MTALDLTLAQQYADDPGVSTDRALVGQLLAEVRRLRALPVLASCGMCSQLGKDCGEYHCDALPMRDGEDGLEYYERTATRPDAPPPSWCPLRVTP